jgi:hypothetical protein
MGFNSVFKGIILVWEGDITILHRDQRSLVAHPPTLFSGEYGKLSLRW